MGYPGVQKPRKSEILVGNINLDSVLIREKKIIPIMASLTRKYMQYPVESCLTVLCVLVICLHPVQTDEVSSKHRGRHATFQTHLPPQQSTGPSSTSCVCSHPWARTGTCSNPTSVLCQTTAVIGHIKYHIRSCMMTNDSERSRSGLFSKGL